MHPKLIVIAGVSQGVTFDIAEPELYIGREAVNRICLVHPSVSRRHALIRQEGEGCRLLDLESLNGTFVNGVPVSERVLEHGDQIAVGDVSLLFLLHDAEGGAGGAAVSFDERNLATQSLVRLRREDALYLAEEQVLAALPPTARVARGLSALLKISTVVNSTHSLAELQLRLLELIFEIVPAERGAILLAGEGGEELGPSASYIRPPGEDGAIAVSLTVAAQALREGVSILSNDVSSDPAVGPTASLVSSRARALLCVPLVAHEEARGVIYLDASDAATRFDEHHLQLLTAIAGIAAVAIENRRYAERLEGENLRLHNELNLKHQMIGESPRMRSLYRFIEKVAPAEATVLLCGESGTGKELAARAIHHNSPRADRSFVAINCATLNETLLESELFGHEKGAFTGAVALKRGKLEVADGGTLFLDEVGELAPNIQAKLLRVLQEREFERVGGTRTIKADIRVIAATNRDLEASVRDGSFRQDLYYRLNVISFTMPPLRERREDIPLLASYFAAECSKRARRRPIRVSSEARSYMMNYNWPGNVRELGNVIERAVVLGSADLIMPEDLPDAILETVTSTGAPIAKFYDAIREFKRQFVLDALRQSDGNYTAAARLLGVHPNNLHRLVRSMNIRDSRPGK
ncbi:MAG TPA: sigma 54-interacting transcriptional regulator [Pyrinomonadaceae bacterium]